MSPLPVRNDVNAITSDDDQDGPMSAAGDDVRRCGFDPSASMIQRSALWELVARQNTIRSPSGDHAGSCSAALELVSLVWFEPSASMTQMLPPPSGPGARHHTIFVPSRDHRGRWSSAMPPVSCWRSLPSGFAE